MMKVTCVICAEEMRINNSRERPPREHLSRLSLEQLRIADLDKRGLDPNVAIY